MRTRSVVLNVRVSPAEKQRIQTAAGRCGLTLSEYLRQRALGYEPRFHPPQTFFSYLTWMENLNEQLEQYDPVLAEQYQLVQAYILRCKTIQVMRRELWVTILYWLSA